MSDHSCIDPSLIDRAQAVVRRLHETRESIVTAESCTAGLLAAVLSHVDGAGDVLHGGFVTYSKQAKTKLLGVDERLLAESGSVNEEVAIAMARGALTRSPASRAVSVTGVLGPEPDEDGNPVGLIFIGCGDSPSGIRIVRHDFGKAPHDQLRHAAVIAALDLALECLR